MIRIARPPLVCLVALLITCSKGPETTTTETATKAPPTKTATAATQPQICTDSVKNCAGVNQCAASPLSAAAANIPTGRRCTPLGEGGGDAQIYVDAFSWNLFLALNWPANVAGCAADSTKSILDVRSGDGTYVVWQTYMPSDQVFVNPASQKPAPWCSGNGLALGEKRVFDDEAKAIAAVGNLGGPFARISEPGKDVLQARGGVVTDQNKRWLRYERLMNQTEYAYIVDGKWNLPLLRELKAKDERIAFPPESMELKSAWKVLTPQEASSGKYFTTRAIVCNTPEGDRTPCNDQPVTMGLVGLHIVQQLSEGGPMFWATFEHKDNDTVFFDPNSKSTPNANNAKKPYVELDDHCNGINEPTQIKRETPIPANQKLNEYYQQLLGDSVFSNYELISTQWATGVANGGTPADVANITLETYVQKLSVDAGRGATATGCFACHLKAKTPVPDQDANHSFLFREAKDPVPPATK